MTDILVRELSRLERPALEPHFLALEGEDRRLRFGAPLNDDAVRAYVARIDFERDAAFGVYDDALHLIGAAHVARGDGHAELGVPAAAGDVRRTDEVQSVVIDAEGRIALEIDARDVRAHRIVVYRYPEA